MHLFQVDEEELEHRKKLSFLPNKDHKMRNENVLKTEL